MLEVEEELAPVDALWFVISGEAVDTSVGVDVTPTLVVVLEEVVCVDVDPIELVISLLNVAASVPVDEGISEVVVVEVPIVYSNQTSVILVYNQSRLTRLCRLATRRRRRRTLKSCQRKAEYDPNSVDEDKPVEEGDVLVSAEVDN